MPVQVTILTPDRCLLTEHSCHQVELPTAGGVVGVLEGHTPMVTPLEIGEVRLLGRDGATTHYIAVASGFVEIDQQRVLVTAHAAEKAEEIDVARATAAKERAEQELRAKANLEVEGVELAMARAANRLRIAHKAQGE
jgi:F-type H+-transporting ATPase subunit epsilon